MKTTIPYIYIFFIIAFLFISCSEDTMTEINTNPNNPTNASAIQILPQVIVESAYGTTGTELAWFASVLCEHSAGVFAQLKNIDNRIGVNNSALFNNNWNNIYLNLFHLKTIINKCGTNGDEAGNTSVLGIAQVLLAYNLGIVVDLWGDAPFSDAFKGKNNFTPKYDKAPDLYNSLQLILDSAIVNLNIRSNSSISASDFIYSGDLKRWKRAAYALKIRYLNRLSSVKNSDDEIIKLLPNAFTSSSESFIFNKFDGETNSQNPWYSFQIKNNHLAVGKTIYDLMLENDDPRLVAYFGGSAISAAPNGLALSDQNGTTYSRSILSEKSAPIPLITYHEQKFIEAEVYLRKLEKVKAYTAFNKAVSASFDYYNTPIDNFLLQLPDVNNLTLNDIYTQKYISLYESASIEAYSEVRRTGIPKMNNPLNKVSSLGFVNRYPYVSDELATNLANIPKLTTADKLFWAK